MRSGADDTSQGLTPRSAPATDADTSAGQNAVLTIQADVARCIGSGLCAHHAPTLFDVTDAGYVQVLEPHPGTDELDGARAAAAACPTGTLTLSDFEQPRGRSR